MVYQPLAPMQSPFHTVCDMYPLLCFRHLGGGGCGRGLRCKCTALGRSTCLVCVCVCVCSKFQNHSHCRLGGKLFCMKMKWRVKVKAFLSPKRVPGWLSQWGHQKHCLFVWYSNLYCVVCNPYVANDGWSYFHFWMLHGTAFSLSSLKRCS